MFHIQSLSAVSRKFLQMTFIALIFAIVVGLEANGASRPSAVKLLTEYRENPVGIDTAEPRLTWQFAQSGRAKMQAAYQVQVASGLRLLESGKPNILDTGKVANSDNFSTPFSKVKPLSSQTYWWRVKVWDKDGRSSPWSKPATFEMGLLRPSEWKGVWIAAPMGGNGYHSAVSENVDTQRWVKIDLGSISQFRAVKLFPARPYNWQEDTPGFGFPVRYKLETSTEPDFRDSKLLIDKSTEDQANPKDRPVLLEFAPVSGRYVRLTASKLYRRFDGKTMLALAEMQVLDGLNTNLAANKPVQASDSVEDNGWGISQLTEGVLHSKAPAIVAPVFRREFTLDSPVRWARAYVAGLGYCELHINGQKVGDKVLDPAYTDFAKRVLYSTYDVTSLLKPGKNAIGAFLGKGWFRQALCMILQLNIKLEDGRSLMVVTGPDWKRGDSPILENSLYHGELYDARLEQPGWDMPGFDDSKWQEPNVIPSPSKILAAETIQPIRVTKTLGVKKLTQPKPGVYVFDFGQNFSGWCRLRISAPRGCEVRLRYSENLYADGTVNQENLRSAKATDRYICKGNGREQYQPRFTYHGFRYVQLEGFPGRPDESTLLGCVVRTDFPKIGSFECSDSLINQIQHNSIWGYQTNFHSIPTDCPQRDERQGWMGDAGIAVETGLYNFGVVAALNKFLQDIREAQGEDGRIPDTVPHVWGTESGDPMWSAAYHFIVWDTYRHTGDKELLAEHYDGLKRYVDMLQREAPDCIITRSNYGDWVGVVPTPKDLIATGSFFMVSQIVSQAAQILGKMDDARKYADLCAQIATAFNTRYFNSETNVYGDGSQFSYVCPLYLGIVPEGHKQAVLDNLVHDILVNHKGHLSSGFIGTRYLFDTLCREGRPDVAYTVVTQKDYPGYGFMIANGATTIWELWRLETGPGMNSHNHPAFGFISGWFYREIAGIVPDWTLGGYERFDIKPYVMGDLKEAKAAIDTIRGEISSHWVRDEKSITLNVVVPANSQANVWVPKIGVALPRITEHGVVVWAEGKFIGRVAGIENAQDAGNWVKFQIGSGAYSFHLTQR